MYLFINRLFGFIEQIEGSSDRYLVVSINNEIIINIFDKLWKFIENKIISDDSNNKIKEYYKLRFDCVIEKDNEYYPKMYLDACSYNKTKA